MNRGFKVKVGRFPFSANGRAITYGDDSGFIKTIFDDKSGELLGAHMIGSEVTELIHGFSIAKKLETTELEINLNPKVKLLSNKNRLCPEGRSTMGMPGTKAKKSIKKKLQRLNEKNSYFNK